VVEDAAVAVLQVVEAGYEVGEHGRLHVEAARRSLGRKQAGQSSLFFVANHFRINGSMGH
jgi:hypothetical protein